MQRSLPSSDLNGRVADVRDRCTRHNCLIALSREAAAWATSGQRGYAGHDIPQPTKVVPRNCIRP